MSDRKPPSDQATTPGDTSKARQGVEWLTQWLKHDSQADVPDGTEPAEPQTSEQAKPAELGPSDEANDTLEQAEGNLEESETETEESESETGESESETGESESETGESETELLAEAMTRPKAEQKRPIKWLEAGLIGSSLLFNAASAEAATQEMAQTQPYAQPEVTCEATAQSYAMREVPLENSPAEVDPEIEVLSDAHDFERQRRIEEDAAGRMLEEPTISAAPPPPDVDPV